MALKRPKIGINFSADLSEYSGHVDAVIRHCIEDAVREGLYDVMRADVRRAYLESDLRGNVLPSIIDEVFMRILKGE